MIQIFDKYLDVAFRGTSREFRFFTDEVFLKGESYRFVRVTNPYCDYW